MLLSFKTSLTNVKFFNFTHDNYVCSEAAFVEHNSIFCRSQGNGLVRFLTCYLIKLTSDHNFVRSFSYFSSGVTFMISFVAYEDELKQLNFLEVTVTNSCKEQHNFKVYRKNVITNIQQNKTNQILLLPRENMVTKVTLQWNQFLNWYIGRKWNDRNHMFAFLKRKRT